eukprot:1512785-Lingulodinium_polyedra.AAC.1
MDSSTLSGRGLPPSAPVPRSSRAGAASTHLALTAQSLTAGCPYVGTRAGAASLCPPVFVSHY